MKCFICDSDKPIETQVGYGFHQRTVEEDIQLYPAGITINGERISMHPSCDAQIPRKWLRRLTLKQLNPKLAKLYDTFVAGKVDLGIKVQTTIGDVQHDQPVKAKPPKHWIGVRYGRAA